MDDRLPTLDDIHRAKARLYGEKRIIALTPLQYSDAFCRRLGCEVWLKLENLQKTGSYKLRGAYNTIASLPSAEREKGVITASAGNHAQGVAYAARVFGVHDRTTIFVPEGTPDVKKNNTKSYGVEVREVGKNFEEAKDVAQAEAVRSQRAFIEPFDDWRTIAGQGTVGLEILEDLPDVDVIVVPVGGGGLISGIAIAAQARQRPPRVIGVQAAGAASMIHALNVGYPTKLPAPPMTVADGIKVGEPGTKTFQVISTLIGLQNMVAVTDTEINTAIADLLIYGRVMSEGAGAVGIAALAARKIDGLTEITKVAVVVSGGNIDARKVWRIVYEREFQAGHYLTIRTTISDRPGELIKLLQPITTAGINIRDVVLKRCDGDALTLTEQKVVELYLETADEQQRQEVRELLTASGYSVQRLNWTA